MGPWEEEAEEQGLIRPLLILALCGGVGGCAVGRNDRTGEIVLGIKAGTLVETSEQALAAAGSAAASALPPPFGDLLNFALIGLGGHLLGRNKGWDEKDQDDIRRRGLASLPASPPSTQPREPSA